MSRTKNECGKVVAATYGALVNLTDTSQRFFMVFYVYERTGCIMYMCVCESMDASC